MFKLRASVIACHLRRALVCLLLASLATSSLPARDTLRVKQTPLDEYVAAADPTFKWKLAETFPGEGATVYSLDMTSQTWRPQNTDRSEWQHRIFISKPAGENKDTAFLYITGGSNPLKSGQKPDGVISLMARQSNSVVVELKNIPNQPLVFNGDGKGRTEDDLIAYTWDKVITTGDPTWSARLPMVKAAIRAMDAVQEFLASEEGGKLTINNFVVAGGSKRGWTTWLVGAVDKRVVAIIPAVIDLLNVKQSMQHHYAAYGFWAPAVGDYVRHKITEKHNHPGYDALLKFEDPYNYLDRLTMPKYVVNASGDQFFVPTSSQFYWNDLKGEKYLRYVPNAEHSLGGSDAPLSIQTFYQSVLNNTPRPKYDWQFEDDGTIRVETPDKPKQVLLWQATNPKARDFRVETMKGLKRKYTSSTLEPVSEGVYAAKVEKPAEGFTAYFIELTFDSGYKNPFKFTTGVRVMPDVLPHADKLQKLLSEQSAAK